MSGKRWGQTEAAELCEERESSLVYLPALNERGSGVQRVIRPPSEDASQLRRDEAPGVIKCKCLLLSEQENFD